MKPNENILQRTEAEMQAAHMLPPANQPNMETSPIGEILREPPARITLATMIFSPAIALMNRLDVIRKFILLGFMSLIAIVMLVHTLVTSHEQVIRTSQRELEGITLIKSFSKTIQIIQQYGGLSAMELGGNKTLADGRGVKEREANDAFNGMLEKLPPRLSSSKDMQRIQINWKQLRKDGLNWTREENIAAHSKLIDQLRLFEVVAADEYELTLDPEIDTYYLIDSAINKLPAAIVNLRR